MAEPAQPTSTGREARLASAQQSLTFLRNQIKSGQIDRDLWLARLDELSEIVNSAAAEHEANDEQRRLAALYEVSRVLGASLKIDEVLDGVLDSIIQLTSAERGFLMLVGDDGRLDAKAARNLDQQTIDEESFAISRSVIDLVVKSGEAVVTTNAASDPRFSERASVISHNLRSIMCVPLRTHGEPFGVIYVDNRVRSGVFNEKDLAMLTAFAAQAAMAIENARLFTQTDQALAQRLEELSMLQQIDRELNETLDFASVMNRTLAWAVKVSGADNGAIGLFDLEAGETRLVATHGEASAGAAELLSKDDAASRDGCLIVPIQREGRAIGAIALDRQDGRPFDAEARSFVLRMADHAAIAIENTRLYEEVRRANLAKSEFVSVMTHELRVPMTAIKGYTEMLGMVGSLNEQQQKFLEIIRSNIVRMAVQVSDLSDISRIESGRLKLEIEEGVPLQPALDEVLAATRSQLDERGHQIVIDLPDDLPALRADTHRLKQVLTNLISNACKYTPPEGTITVRARGQAGKEGNMVRCEVEDTGVGMTPEEIARLYTKFWRSDDRFVREQPGTGLGLAIARNLVEMQGGELDVRSEKGKGTCFSFTIPAGG